ncbi:MAG: hypothetical protein ABI613_03855 [Gemmatimonadota bacterium]
MDLPSEHRVPFTWLLQNAGETVRYRTLTELAPEGSRRPEELHAIQQAIVESKIAHALVRKQKESGIWSGNLLGLAPAAAQGIKDVGTIPHYRRLIQLGYPREARPFKLTERVLFRLLSRDEDPALLFEYQKLVKSEPLAKEWARNVIREAATAALAEAGHLEDPRVRGAAHKIANEVSHFLRSPFVEKPFIRSGSHTVLHPGATPPTWYSVAMIAAMPNLQRERAGFTERLGQYLAQPAPKKAFVVQVGKKALKPQHLLLGDPIEADSKGNAEDLPLALHFIELLARIGALHTAPVATKVLSRLLKDCDESGVWHPRNLRSQPKLQNRAAYHCFPLETESKHPETRQVDVTFRLALIAKLLGWHVVEG